MKKILRAIVVVLAVIGLLIGAGLFFLSSPTEPEPKIQPNEKSTELKTKMAEEGIKALADVNKSRSLVRYYEEDIPNDFNHRESMLFALGRAASTSPNSTYVIAQVYNDQNDQVGEAKVKTDHAFDYAKGEINKTEFIDKINFSK